jgi:hypothetical protein
MCEATLIVAVAGTVLSAVQQQQQAKAATESGVRTYANSLETYAERQRQINDKAEEDMSDRAREAMVERGRLRVIAGESGISGNSGDQLERQSYFDEGFDVSRIEGQRKDDIQQSYLDAKGGQAGAQSRLNSIKQPSFIGSCLLIAVDYYKSQTKPNPPTPYVR